MTRNIVKFVVLALMIAGGWAGLDLYKKNTGEAHLREEIAIKDKKIDLLRGIVDRLQTDKRLARVIVTKSEEAAGDVQNTLLFAEYDRTGKDILPARQFTVNGRGVHIEALVLEFEGKYVEENEPLRGHSIAIFKRLYGDTQSPHDAFVLDSPGEAPDVYKNSDPALAKFEAPLWKDFWKLVDDPDYRKQVGVKLAYGAGTFHEQFKKGWVYTLLLSPTGGLKMTSDKMDPMWERSLTEAGEPNHTAATSPVR